MHLRRFPEVPHTWARMRDGTFCGGGIVAIKPRALPLLERFIERSRRGAQAPVQACLALRLGYAGALCDRPALDRAAEARATRILGAPVRALVSPYPETGVNVDRVSDVALARDWYARRLR